MSAALKGRITELVRQEVTFQTGTKGVALKPADIVKEMDSLQTRIDSMKSSVLFATGVRGRQQKDHLKSYSREVAKACCPLKPVNFLDNRDWTGRYIGLKKELRNPKFERTLGRSRAFNAAAREQRRERMQKRRERLKNVPPRAPQKPNQ